MEWNDVAEGRRRSEERGDDEGGKWLNKGGGSEAAMEDGYEK